MELYRDSGNISQYRFQVKFIEEKTKTFAGMSEFKIIF
jgi:hypothetical protein